LKIIEGRLERLVISSQIEVREGKFQLSQMPEKYRFLSMNIIFLYSQNQYLIRNPLVLECESLAKEKRGIGNEGFWAGAVLFTPESVHLHPLSL
jgi:hypothetical protein